MTTRPEASVTDPAPSTAEPRVRAIAYYLPQYHPIPENDAWWGKGFTEWTNVTRAKPLFDGHHQPHLPSELGFYDLRVPEVREAQAALARAYGIEAFCYYYYWFGKGRRLLERPLREVLESGKPDFPFCVCWANESWSRRWDGGEAEVLVAQDDSDATYRAFIDEILPFLRDPRYVRVGGRPLLLVYRVGRMRDARRTAEAWREAAVAAGLPGLYLAAVQSHDPSLDPRPHGFDAAVEFPPSPWNGRQLARTEVPGLDPDFHGRLFDYDDLVARFAQRAVPEYRLFRGVMTSWDNTARKGPGAYVFPNATPRAYESWLRSAVAWTEAHNPPDERIVFVNAWNEWAEGAHLEPDQRDGRAWLEATARALTRGSDWRAALAALERGDALTPELRRRHADELRFALEAAERAILPPALPSAALRDELPAALAGKPLTAGARFRLERVRGAVPAGRIVVRRGDPVDLAGWSFAPGLDARRSQTFLLLQSPNHERLFVAPVPVRSRRDDVAFQHRGLDPWITTFSGFEVRLETGAVAPGEYRLAYAHADGERIVASACEHRVIVEP